MPIVVACNLYFEIQNLLLKNDSVYTRSHSRSLSPNAFSSRLILGLSLEPFWDASVEDKTFTVSVIGSITSDTSIWVKLSIEMFLATSSYQRFVSTKPANTWSATVLYTSWVLSQFEFLSIVTIWDFEFCHNWNFCVMSQFEFFFYFCQN